MRYLADPAALTPGLLAWVVLAFVAIAGPYGALKTHRRISAGTLGLGRPSIYLNALFWQALLVWLSWAAALLSALVFGASHLAQGPRTAAIVVLYGLRDQVVVGLTGTLYAAMAVHLLHDVVVGTVAGRRARRADALEAAAPEAPPPVPA